MQLHVASRIALAAALIGASLTPAIPAIAGGPPIIVPGKPVVGSGIPGITTLTASLTSSDAQNVRCPGSITVVASASGPAGQSLTYLIQSNFNGKQTIDHGPITFTMPSNGTASQSFTESVPVLTGENNNVELIVGPASGTGTQTYTIPVSCYALPAPTHVAELKTKSDCDGTVASTEQPGCYATITSGGLALKFDESTSVDGFRFYRVDGGRHDMVTALAFGKSKYLLVPGTSGPFPGRCYAVEAYTATLTSKDSEQFCATDASIAKAITIRPNHQATVVGWNVPLIPVPNASNCSDDVSAATVMGAVNNDSGSKFAAYFPLLLNIGAGAYTGSTQSSGLYAGAENVPIDANYHFSGLTGGSVPICTSGAAANETPTLAVGSKFGLSFDVKKYEGHTIYSATIKFDTGQDLLRSGSTFSLGNGPSCARKTIGTATASWWNSQSWNQWSADTTKPLDLHVGGATSIVDVTTPVSDWASDNDSGDNGFIVDGLADAIGNANTPSAVGVGSALPIVCVSAYENPRLDLVYF